MLRDFSLNERIRLRTLQQYAAQALHFMESAHAAKLAGCLMQDRTDPAKQHMPILPALDVARVVGHQAVQVLDRIGAPERPVERAVDAELGDGEGFIEPLAKARGGPRMGSGDGMGEAFKLSLGKKRILGLPSNAQ